MLTFEQEESKIGTQFGYLSTGDTFIYNGGYWMRTDEEDTNAVELSGGALDHFLPGRMVVPVEITCKVRRL